MMTLLRRIVPPSGGLLYHYLALRFSGTLWRPFLQNVADWLDNWNPTSKELIIFGSSAGYSLPPSFLRRFERVICVEPDPWARLLLRRRFKNAPLEFVSDRGFLTPVSSDHKGSHAKLALDKLKEFISKFPNAAILFSNVLGQLPLEFPHLSDEIFASHLVAVRATLRGRVWASYHDLLSTWATPKSMAPMTLPPGALDLDQFARQHLHPPALQDTRLELTDHQTHALSAGEPVRCAWWQLAPGRFHLIGYMQSH